MELKAWVQKKQRRKTAQYRLMLMKRGGLALVEYEVWVSG